VTGEFDKKTHFGRAGEYFAMSELLLRGWNVAVPVVDVGDDVFIIDDNDKTTRRLQVKTAAGVRDGTAFPPKYNALFGLSRRQLREAQPIELFFLFLARIERGWRFLIVPRYELVQIRDDFVNAPRPAKRGRPPVADAEAMTDGLTFNITIEGSSAYGWGSSLSRFLDQWPAEIPEVTGGPGSVALTEREGAPAPSRDPET
jgi:hypothetical protein